MDSLARLAVVGGYIVSVAACADEISYGRQTVNLTITCCGTSE